MTRENLSGTNSVEAKWGFENYREAKRWLKKTIQDSKKHAWRRLCDELERDVWGRAFQLVMKRGKVVPERRQSVWPKGRREGSQLPLFGREEVWTTVAQLKPGKVPGPDGIPLEVIKGVKDARADEVTGVMNFCLSRAQFPKCWKMAKLVLAEKPSNNENMEKSYRRICLINSAGKLYETLLKNPILRRSWIVFSLFGFRRDKKTIDALEIIEEAMALNNSRAYGNRGKIALLTLNELRSKNVSAYLVDVVQTYLSSRYVEAETVGRVRMWCGVPQESVLGPTLWNVLYDQILRVDLGEGREAIAYADDLAILMSASSKTVWECRLARAADAVSDKLRCMGLTLAPQKTELIILAGRRQLKNTYDMVIA
ncbi:hypothetical protein GWI33_000167 [Rhynchophorus ferrugineus]|uniref:Reverse transcriptase domain-containing protein n=1 Tax=Rhynchophorus ferrugineus TaxID=354439 RepID=A0A834IYI1_RHYFE|nr:hypothetical protein GWI33_000167 [Rhynchophorus ferrugineus]